MRARETNIPPQCRECQARQNGWQETNLSATRSRSKRALMKRDDTSMPCSTQLCIAVPQILLESDQSMEKPGKTETRRGMSANSGNARRRAWQLIKLEAKQPRWTEHGRDRTTGLPEIPGAYSLSIRMLKKGTKKKTKEDGSISARCEVFEDAVARNGEGRKKRKRQWGGPD